MLSNSDDSQSATLASWVGPPDRTKSTPDREPIPCSQRGRKFVVRDNYHLTYVRSEYIAGKFLESNCGALMH